MSVVKSFECEECGALGKITIRGSEVEEEDIVFCPVCGHEIFEDEEDEDE